MLSVYNDRTDDSTSVPNRFIDEFMPDANDAQIKVYLYLLRAMNAGRSVSITTLADQFNHTEREVLRSLRYWEKRGLLALDFDSEKNLTGIHFCDPEEKSEPEQGDSVISLSSYTKRTYASGVSASGASASGTSRRSTAVRASSATDSEALEAFRSDKKREELLFIIEQYVGKPLSVSEIRTICYISETLHFSDDLIDYLVQYCIDRGKKDFRYIEKVAVNWSENGITTPRQAAAGQADKDRGRRSGRKNPFNQFEQNQYNFSELEKTLLDN